MFGYAPLKGPSKAMHITCIVDGSRTASTLDLWPTKKLTAKPAQQTMRRWSQAHDKKIAVQRSLQELNKDTIKVMKSISC